MSRDPQLKNERNKAIKDGFAKLAAETVNGLNGKKEQKYRHSAIVAILSNRFYLAPDTIRDILTAPEDEENSNQIKIFE